MKYSSRSMQRMLMLSVGFVLAILLFAAAVPAGGMAAGAGARQGSVPAANDSPSGTLASGSCGASASWSLNSDGLLTISGTGSTDDYTAIESFRQVVGSNAPWNDYDGRITQVVIGEGITRLGDYAFTQVESIREIRLPSTLTSIGAYAFYRTNITEIVLPDALRSIGDYCFREMTFLYSIQLPTGFQTLGTGVFVFSSLRSISLPVSLTKIPDYTFYGIYGLTSVRYAGTQSQWDSIEQGAYNDPLSTVDLILNSSPFTGTRSGTCGTGLTWTLTEAGVLTISGSGSMADYTLTRRTPEGSSTIDFTGYQKTYVANTPWNDEIESIRQVQIASGVTRIGNNAFYNCFRLRSVSLPDSLVSIGASAFCYCSEIRSIRLPDSVRTMDERTFYGCCLLEDIQLSAGLKTLPAYCFDYCGALKTLVLPEGMESVEEGAFGDCGLTDVTFPSTLRSLHPWHNLGTGYGRDITLRFRGPVPEGLEEKALLSYKNIYCPAAYYADYKAYLAPILYRVSYRAYKENQFGCLCTGGDAASLDSSLITMDEEHATARLTASVNGVTSGVSVSWSSSDSSRIQISESGELTALVRNGGALITGEVTYQGNTTLTFCPVMFVFKEINPLLLSTLPTEGIRPNNLATCNTTVLTSLEGIVGYRPVQYVETDTSNTYYQQLSALVSQLTAGCSTNREKVTAILGWISANIDYSLTSVCIGETPDQVYAVYLNKTGNCQGFTKLAGFMYALAGIPGGSIVNDGHMWNVVLLDGSWVMLDAQYGKSAFTADYTKSFYKNIKYITFAQGDCIFIVDEPGDVKLAGMGTGSLSECRAGITRVTVPDFVTTVYGYAFNSCPDLKEVRIPDTVTAIGPEAFSSCPSLTTVTLPKGITSVRDGTFSDCSALTSIALPEGVTSIGAKAFYRCSALKTITLPDGVTSIGEDAFYSCSALTSITLPEGVTSIGAKAFNGCSALSGAVIPASVTAIGDYAFNNYTMLLYCYPGSAAQAYAEEHYLNFRLIGAAEQTMLLPASMTRIESETFAGLAQGMTLVVPEGVTFIADDAFGESSNALLSVAAGSYAEQWARAHGMLYIVR